MVVASFALCISLLLGATLGLEWKPLESSLELCNHDLLLSLSSVPWCGESRSFMRDFLEPAKQAFPDLELRFVNVRKQHDHEGTASPIFSSRDVPFLTLFRFCKAYEYVGKLSPDHVLASLEHAVSTDPRDTPLKMLESAEQVEEFVDSTDRALLLVDLCGWAHASKGEVVEASQDSIVGVGVSLTGEALAVNRGFTSTNVLKNLSSTEEDARCLSHDRNSFDVIYSAFTGEASKRFLNPDKARFGVVSSLKPLEHTGLSIPPTKSWALIGRVKDMARSWSLLENVDQLEAFSARRLLVDEVDVSSKYLGTSPAVLLFINRGSYIKDMREKSKKALDVVREVAEHYVPRHLEDIEKVSSEGKSGNAESYLVSILSANLNEVRSVKRKLGAALDVEVGKLDSGHEGGVKEEAGTTLAGSGFIQEDAPVSTDDEQVSAEEQKNEETDASSIFFGFFEGPSSSEESLTGKNASRPSLVVLSREPEACYVYPDDLLFTVSNLKGFLDQVLTGSFRPSVLSEASPPTPRHLPRPPFVNLDFHEVNGVPQLTLNTFREFTAGRDESRTRDSLVLLTLPWCGFCRRMEVILREVYRYFKFYFEPSDVCLGYHNGNISVRNTEDHSSPMLFQMDCSKNDCDEVLSNIIEEDGYPTLVLFPAQREDAPVVYTGPPTVMSIFEFIAAYGTGSAFTRFFGGVGARIQASPVRIEAGAVPRAESITTEATAPGVRIALGQVLMATKKLSDALFHKSAILIVSVGVDHVMGLIINKRMDWETLPSLSLELKNVEGAFLSQGGPIYENPMDIYTLTEVQDLEGFIDVQDGLRVGGPSATEKVFQLIEGKNVSASNFLFVAGHCGWTWTQLQQEVAAGYWDVTQYRKGLFQWLESEKEEN